jgi:hypothetical protein
VVGGEQALLFEKRSKNFYPFGVIATTVGAQGPEIKVFG